MREGELLTERVEVSEWDGLMDGLEEVESQCEEERLAEPEEL